MVQAGATRLTTIGGLLEWQHDWANKEHYNNLMTLLKQHAGAYGPGVEYAYTMVHHAPQSAQKPQVVVKKAYLGLDAERMDSHELHKSSRSCSVQWSHHNVRPEAFASPHRRD